MIPINANADLLFSPSHFWRRADRCLCWSMLLLCCSLVGISTIHAQEISRAVLGSAGDFYVQPGGESLDFTVGELSIKYTERADGRSLAEGFHHTLVPLTVRTVNPHPDWEVQVFPNPFSAYLKLVVQERMLAQEAELFNAWGQIMGRWSISSPETILELTNLPAGVYWLRLTDEAGRRMSVQLLKI